MRWGNEQLNGENNTYRILEAGDAENEMKIFDLLGERTRNMLNNLPFIFSATSVARVLKRQFPGKKWNDKDCDKYGARILKRNCINLMMQMGLITEEDIAFDTGKVDEFLKPLNSLRAQLSSADIAEKYRKLWEGTHGRETGGAL